jgi:serine/threonine-protein kinase RsbT
MTGVSTLHEIPIREEADILQIRQTVREVAVSVGLSLVAQTKVVTAASELARNTLTHGGGGTARIELERGTTRSTLWLRFQDRGAGIPDVERALTEGYSSVG